MHVPDGFLVDHISLATGVVAAAGVVIAARHAARELSSERTPAVVAVTGAAIFAGQMMNFPVGAGTSGHLIGAALAVTLLGPGTACLVLSAVLLVQAVFFADGGLTALGTNITLMGIVAVLAAWAVFAGLRRVLPDTRRHVALASAVAGLVSVPAAALAFVGLFAIGAHAHVDLGAVFAEMFGWHLLIGVGEAVITGGVVAAVLAARPELVRGYAPRRTLPGTAVSA